MREDIVKAMCILSKVYPNQKIDDELISAWDFVLSDLSDIELSRAVGSYLRSSAEFFPKPGQIYSIARPNKSKDQDEEAALITDDIFTALRSYGSDKVGIERARTKIGPVGWAYIQRQGGWETFINSIQSEDSIPILKAQVRRSVSGLLSQTDKYRDQLQENERNILEASHKTNTKTLQGSNSWVPKLVSGESE